MIARAQLEGQVASAKIGLARLASPQIYYVLSGNDFTLDVNNPNEPKIVCVGNIHRSYKSMEQCLVSIHIPYDKAS
jgi:hypothetical protein